MDEVFKCMIEENFHQTIFDSLQREIVDNYSDYDLALRSNIVIEVLEASLDNIEILKVYNIVQDEEEVFLMFLLAAILKLGMKRMVKKS